MNRIQFHLYSSFVALYIIHLFIDSQVLLYLQGIIGILAFLVSVKGANKTYQLIGLVFTLVAGAIFIWYNLPISDLILFYTSMGLLLSLLYLIPFINHLMIVGKFDEALYQVLQTNTQHLGKFYTKSYFTSYILTLFIFLSTIPLVYQFVKDKTSRFQDSLTQQFATRSILRPFAAANVWSPIEVYIALVVAITGSYYLHLLPILLGFSLTMLAIDMSLGYLKFRKYTIDQVVAGKEKLSRETYWKLLSLVGFLAGFIAFATLTHVTLGIEFFDAIILVIMPYTFLWAWLTQKLRTFIRYNQKVWHEQVWTMQNFMMLLLPVGFFNEVVGETGLFEPFISQLAWMETQPLYLFIFIQLSSMVLAFVGFHPLVTLSLQGLFVTPFLDTINPLSISVVMIIAVVSNDMTGTFNVPITMLNQYLKRNPYRLTGWNIGYALLFGSIGITIGYLLL
ncbi:hypothetical protein [Halalkalibacillus halophilus]|uniref:hypothetical protein n=1 Tax=Halalkalibacillus halophilus TaxID=392827 RepID=UPI00041FAA2C|nr:hypothetical protein [Halalkalibacillus halophilus]